MNTNRCCDDRLNPVLRRPDGVRRATRICTTEEAYKALTTGEQIPVGEPAWHLALAAIVKALLDPTRER